MSKAIKVTQELKIKNSVFFNGNTVDSIVIKTIPDVFKGAENINAGGYKLRTDLQSIDGWKEVIIPSYNTQTQKLGTLIEVDSTYTYQVVDLTAEQIEDVAQAELDSDTAQNLIDKRKGDGVKNFDRLMAIIERRFRIGDLSGAIAKGLMVYFDENLACITRGNWIVAKDNLSNAPATSNTDALSIYNTVKNKVDNYVTENY